MKITSRVSALLTPNRSRQPVMRRKAAEFEILPRGQAGRAVFSDWDPRTAINDGLKSNTWVYVANRFIATKVSPVPIIVEQLTGEVWERAAGHPAEILINEPNPIMSGQDLRERWLYNLGLAGNALGNMTTGGRPEMPLEIWPVMPQDVKPVPNADGTIAHYEMTTSGKKKLDTVKMIHLMYTDPSSFYWGLSPLQAAARVVDTDVEAVKWNKSALQNKAKKDYAFFPAEPLDEEEWKSARQQLQDQHTGYENAGGWFIGGMPGTLTELGMSPHDMDWIQGRNMNLMEILAAYGLPEILVTGKGILRNYETAVIQFWQDLAVPILEDMTEEFNRSIMPWFDPPARNSLAQATLRYNFDRSVIPALQEDFSKKIDQAKKLVDLGYPLNIVNQRLGLGFDDVEGGDSPRQITLFSDRPEETKEIIVNFDGDVEWKKLSTQRIEWEKQVERDISAIFHREAQALRGLGTASEITQALRDFAPQWQLSLEVIYRAVIEFFGEQELIRLLSGISRSSTLPPSLKADPVFNPLATLVTEWVTRVAQAKRMVMQQSTESALLRLVSDGVASGQSTDQIARSVRNKYAEWTDTSMPTRRSFVIARTETGAAQNWAQMEAARQTSEQTGLRLMKRWISSRDNRVRDEHMAVDGETVELEAHFSNGLLHPNDPSGPAASVVNCRCAASNVVVR